jgi:hypothetical protein
VAATSSSGIRSKPGRQTQTASKLSEPIKTGLAAVRPNQAFRRSTLQARTRSAMDTSAWNRSTRKLDLNTNAAQAIRGVPPRLTGMCLRDTTRWSRILIDELCTAGPHCRIGTSDHPEIFCATRATLALRARMQAKRRTANSHAKLNSIRLCATFCDTASPACSLFARFRAINYTRDFCATRK